MIGSRVEESRCCMNELSPRESVVCIKDRRKIISVNLDSHTHPHMLGALYNHTLLFQKIPLLKCLETKVIKEEIAFLINHCLKHILIFANNVMVLVCNDAVVVVESFNAIQKSCRSVLVVIVDEDSCGKFTLVRMVARLHHGTGLGCKLVQFASFHTILELIANLLRDQIRVHMLKVSRETANPLEDLVKRDRNARAVTLDNVEMIRHVCHTVYRSKKIRFQGKNPCQSLHINLSIVCHAEMRIIEGRK